MYAAEYVDTYKYANMQIFQISILNIARNVSLVSEIISDCVPFIPISEQSDVGFGPISESADSV